MAWVENDLKDHLVSTPLPQAGSPTTRPGCPELHPAWPWMHLGMGHPQPPWATCSSAPPPSEWKTSSSIRSWSLPSPDWRAPGLSACPHRGGAPALWSSSWSSGHTPTTPCPSCVGGSRTGRSTPGGVSQEQSRGAESPPSTCRCKYRK